MAKRKPERKDFPRGLRGNRQYQLALQAYNNPERNAENILSKAFQVKPQPRKGQGGTTETSKPNPLAIKPKNPPSQNDRVGVSTKGGNLTPDSVWEFKPGKPVRWNGQAWEPVSKSTAEKKPTTPPISAPERQTTTTRTPAPKPKPKKPAPGYQKSESGYYRGTSAESRSKYEAELAKKSGSTSGNPLLDRFRRDTGRDAKTGERQYSTPADKSQYVDKNGKLKIQDKPKPQPVAAKPKPKPPTTKTGGNTPASGVSFTASEEAKGRSGFNPRGTDRPRVIPPGYKWDPKLKRVVKK